jgi:hypothetical protein
MHIPSAETLHAFISSRPTQALYFLSANTNLMSLAEAVHAYTSSFIGPCDILICQPAQSYPPGPKRCMCMPQELLALAIYLFVGHPNHIPLGRSAVCIPLLVVAGIISHAVLSPPTGSCRSGQNAVPYLASTFYTRVGRDRLDRLERLNVQPYWSALSV